MLTDTGAQQAGRVVGHLAKLLLDGLIDHGSTGNVRLYRLASASSPLPPAHWKAFSTERSHSLRYRLRSACLLTGLGSLLSRAVSWASPSEPPGPARQLFSLTRLLLSLLGTAFLALGHGRSGFLLLLFASTGLLIVSLRRLSVLRLFRGL